MHFVRICVVLWTRMQILSSVTVTFSFIRIRVFLARIRAHAHFGKLTGSSHDALVSDIFKHWKFFPIENLFISKCLKDQKGKTLNRV